MRAVVGKRSAPFFLFYNFVLCSFFMINAFCSFGIKSIRAMAQVTAIPSTSTQFQRTRLMNATFTSWAFSPSYMGDSDGAVASRPFILNHPPTWTLTYRLQGYRWKSYRILIQLFNQSEYDTFYPWMSRLALAASNHLSIRLFECALASQRQNIGFCKNILDGFYACGGSRDVSLRGCCLECSKYVC